MLSSRQQTPSFRPIGSVAHAAEVLKVVADESGAIGVNEIARRVGLDASSVSRIVRTLEIYRLLEREPATNRVTLGIGLVTLASDVLYGLDVRRLAAPELDRLSAATHETINLGVWDGDGPLIVDHRPGLQPIAALGRIGRRDPAHASSLGKVLLAFQPEATRRAVLDARPKRFTPTTISEPVALEAALADVRVAGYAVNRGELRPDLHAVAAPVFGLDDTVVAAIGVAGPSSRLTESRMAELADIVMGVASSVSHAMGGGPTTGDGQRGRRR
jgi:DNA-binding IclR family transcriptional regulator